MARPRLSPEPPGVPARRAALKLLDAVLRRGQALEAALDHAAKDLGKREDRALAHAITATVLRRLPDLDALIDSATQRRLPDDAKARSVLRIALAQALLMDTPQHAAISTVLPLVDGGPRKLVHGVFGTLMRSEASLPAHPSLPDSVAMRWREAWGGPMLTGAAHAIAQVPPIDISLRDAGETDALAGELGGTSLLPGHIRLGDGPSVPDREGFAEGRWWVQDIAASLPARLLGGGSGRALDLCAAPGGKTLQLAAAGWDVTALDISESRLGRLHQNFERTGLSANTVIADALKWQPDEPFDVVLIDAPCSATGIFRRHPDVLHRVHPRLIADMAELQTQMLARAADWVRPGGLIVYATCSLEPAEGEAQIDAFLQDRDDFRIDPALPDELPDGILADPRGWVRTLPGMLEPQGGIDGFFICRMMRTG